MREALKGGFAAVVTVAGCLALATSAAATTINVSSNPPLNTDTVADDGICSLRDAMKAANTNMAQGTSMGNDCPAGQASPTVDVIEIPPGTFPLSGSAGDDLNLSGDLDISESVYLHGQGDQPGGTEIDAGSVDRVIDVLNFGGMVLIDVTLDHLTIANGSVSDSGGAIRASDGDGDLSILDSTIADSDALAGGVGGGLFRATGAGGSNFIDRTEFTGNTAAGDGGAIYISPIAGPCAQLREDLFAGNSTQDEGGAIYQADSNTDASCVQYRNDTFSGNSAALGGGAVGFGGPGPFADFRFSTFTGNSTPAAGEGGALRTDLVANQHMELHESILAHNTAAGVDASCAGPPASYASTPYNIESANTCHFTTASPFFDLVNTDPLLAPLADNGGQTRTHGLYDESPAIDNALEPFCTPDSGGMDQRGASFPRPLGAACDTGAFEGSVGPVPKPPASGSAAAPAVVAPVTTTKKKKCKKKKKKRHAAAAKKKCKKKKK